ncbi:ThiF family adenylyltransferase [Streptomyces radicis]|uniref:ThiF family adenylyltransferase n=1 Tax=Streptomyces radicis TaxID=1750517 RepID=A0A3A9W814_9ACTN|nr:ThiF family adenylyltransferase [Streptomyces radicis]RKN09000.1 ThiF family adenylyltransferase [Streptomyces radicis]RKN22809.1 ThiF family adenylyltransferase [Streptomyces radicis]
MHPMIKPSLRRGWRDRQTVRYGVTPAHSVLLGPVDSATQSFLALLDGTRALPALRDAATTLGLGRGAADRLAERLAAAGVLDDATADREAAAQVTDGLRPDLASLSLLHPRPGAGLAALVGRRGMRVQVRGAGRVGTAVATALSQAGVGTVEVVDGGRVEPEDTAPGGLRAEHVGRRRAAAARSLVRAVVPWRRGGAGGAGGAAKGGGTRLVILAPRDGLAAYAPDPAAAEELITAGVPHLYTGVVEATGFVGPLVLPGASACAGCLLRRRAAREPCWPLLVAQWRNARWPGVPACDGPLATAVAGLAACAALGFLDGSVPPSASTRTELALPRLSATTETIEPHQECSCGAARSTRPP